MRKPFSAFLLVVVLVCLTKANAQIKSLDGAAFREQAEQIRRDLFSSDKYSEIIKSDRELVLSLLGRMEARLDGEGGVAGLSEQAKIATFNEQEQVNTILAGAAEDSRQVCRREVVVGSNRRQNVCMTLAQRRRSAEMARDDIGDMQRSFQSLSK